MGKKIKKLISKGDIAGQLLHKAGLPDPIGDALGLSPGAIKAAEAAEKLEKEAGSMQAPSATPTAVSDETLSARDAQRKRQLAMAGLSGTNLTGSRGLGGAASTSTKTLLGS
jgi:hypothetical protein